MSQSSQISIRSLLLLTAVFGVACVPLGKPSAWWALLLPTFGCLLSVFVISRFATSPERGRVFWGGFFAGVATYLAVVLFVGFFCSLRYRGTDVWDQRLGMPVWYFLHGDVAFRSNPQRLSDDDLLSFLVSLHVVIAMLVSAAAAFVAQFFAARRERLANLRD